MHTRLLRMFAGRVLIVGYGSLGQGLTPLLFRHFTSLRPGDVCIVTADERGRDVAAAYGVAFHVRPLTRQNFAAVLEEYLRAGDLLLNLSVEVSSLDLVKWCQEHDVLYLDTCIEPWAGGYDDRQMPYAQTTNYWLREQVLALRRPQSPARATAIMAHGANPGLVSHFAKQGLIELAAMRGLSVSASFAELARDLGIRIIHIAERDTQHDGTPLDVGEFSNTWSADGLISEAYQRAELGWGTHERTLPHGAFQHAAGCQSGIWLDAHSATVKVHSWVPSTGAQSAYLITHHEALSLADFLTIRDDAGDVTYRPTVFYAYHPSEKTVASMENWIASGFAPPRKKTLMRERIRQGHDELGVLFVYDGGAFWYGSTLAHEEAASLAPFNNATSLQVAASTIGALQWMFDHPRQGVVEAEDLPHDAVLSVAAPYLGQVRGVPSRWQPPGDGLQFASFLSEKASPL